MALASKLSFVKGEIDEITIHYENGNVNFIDEEFNSNQIFAERKFAGDTKFPNIKTIIPTKNNFVVTVSQKLIKDIAALKAPKGYVDLHFNTKNNVAAILITANSEELNQKAILMPIDKSRDEEEGS